MHENRETSEAPVVGIMGEITIRQPQVGEIYFRAAACTGALYEIELYIVTGDVPGLDAGVYHFNPADVSLRLLRKGDFPWQPGTGDGQGTRGR